MADEPIEIRRYPNRRLYDRSRRRYVTLGDIEELVREGQVVEVRDSRTGEDLTRQILTQILLERHPDKMELFPAALLHGLLRANDLATGFWQTYLRHAMQTLEGLQRTVAPFGAPQPWFSALMPGFTPPAPPPSPPQTGTDDLAQRLATLEERLARLETIGTPGPTTPPAPAPDEADGTDAGTVDRLEQRLNNLERRRRRRS